MPLTRHFKNKADDQALDDVSSSSNGDSAHNLASSAFMKVYQMTIKNVKNGQLKQLVIE